MRVRRKLLAIGAPVAGLALAACSSSTTFVGDIAVSPDGGDAAQDAQHDADMPDFSMCCGVMSNDDAVAVEESGTVVTPPDGGDDAGDAK
jgi:hypothetical protein